MTLYTAVTLLTLFLTGVVAVWIVRALQTASDWLDPVPKALVWLFSVLIVIGLFVTCSHIIVSLKVVIG